MLTLLGLTVVKDKILASPRSIGACVELLVTRTLQGSAEVDKGITLHSKRTVRVARVEDGCGRDATKSTSEGLRVGLADSESVRKRDGAEESEGGSELHFVDKNWIICIKRIVIEATCRKKRMIEMKVGRERG